MTPREFLEKQGYTEFVTPPGQETFSPSFQWGTVLILLDQYKSESMTTEASKALPLLEALEKIMNETPDYSGHHKYAKEAITNYKNQ